MDRSWARLAAARFQPSMILADPVLNDERGLKLAITVSPQFADKLKQRGTRGTVRGDGLRAFCQCG